MKEQNSQGQSSNKLLLMALGALGIVYGDIGTSPLYAMKECFHGPHAVPLNETNIFGALSLIFWSLVLIISGKYLILLLRADNDGEGGILALMELVMPKKAGYKTFIIVTLGLFGAALLYGDGIITPAISVLSAVEGLNLVAPMLHDFIIPITIGILFFLYLMQKRGTEKVGRIFGPVMILWFSTLGILGINSILDYPQVLECINPYYAIHFFTENGLHSVFILGSVFLVVTGGEAIYADMGHFGKKPIRIAWFAVVLPCLLLNYFGQGALLLTKPEAANNPFYNLAPVWALIPLILLSTFAAVIASQAVISGAFSLTFQALHLGYLPRMEIQHTSEEERGQIYIPQLNWAMFAAVVFLVISFKSSSNLAAAYGIAVVSTMVITTVMLYRAMRMLWKWPLYAAIPVIVFIAIVDLSFFGANIIKVLQGGWMPLALGIAIYILMSTWYKGRKIVRDEIRKQTHSIENFITEYLTTRQITIPGTAIYMSRDPIGAPPSLVHNIKHNKILHKQVIILTILFEKVPHIYNDQRVEIKEQFEGFVRVIARYGFMDKTNIQQVLDMLCERGLKIKISDTTFFLGRETLTIKTKNPAMSKWREKIFIIMAKNSQRATEFFNIPPDRVFEIGTQVEI